MPILQSGQRRRGRVLEDASNEVVNQVANLFQRFIRMQQSLNASVWSDPQFTPEQILADLGNDAIIPIVLNERLMDTITRLATREGISVELALPPFDYTKNGNGTVTVDRNNPFNPNTK